MRSAIINCFCIHTVSIPGSTLFNNWQPVNWYAQDARQAIDLLEFAVFDRLVVGIINAVVMIEVPNFTLKRLGSCWLIDLLDIPTRRLVS